MNPDTTQTPDGGHGHRRGFAARNRDRILWSVAGLATIASVALMAVMATDWGALPDMPETRPAPTTTQQTAPTRTTEAPSTGPVARPTGPSGPAPNTGQAPPAQRRQAPAQPAPQPVRTKSQKPAAPPAPTPIDRPDCTTGGVTYHPGEPGYEECAKPRRGPGED